MYVETPAPHTHMCSHTHTHKHTNKQNTQTTVQTNPSRQRPGSPVPAWARVPPPRSHTVPRGWSQAVVVLQEMFRTQHHVYPAWPPLKPYLRDGRMCVCVCVCVCERECDGGTKLISLDLCFA